MPGAPSNSNAQIQTLAPGLECSTPHPKIRERYMPRPPHLPLLRISWLSFRGSWRSEFTFLLSAAASSESPQAAGFLPARLEGSAHGSGGEGLLRAQTAP